MTYLQELTNTRQKQASTMVAGISSKILQIRKESIKQSLSDLNTLDHRQDLVATIDGVMYYDDSRAENVNATWFTFENIVKPVVWIAGGKSDESDFKDLHRVAKKKVRALVCLGDGSDNLKKTFQKDIKDIYEASSMEDAVKAASLLAQEDDIVLFSPACKSSDKKETYVERGDRFTESVKQLENELRK